MAESLEPITKKLAEVLKNSNSGIDNPPQLVPVEDISNDSEDENIDSETNKRAPPTSSNFSDQLKKLLVL